MEGTCGERFTLDTETGFADDGSAWELVAEYVDGDELWQSGEFGLAWKVQ